MSNSTNYIKVQTIVNNLGERKKEVESKQIIFINLCNKDCKDKQKRDTKRQTDRLLYRQTDIRVVKQT